jgi:hypothetical protein
LGRDEKAKVFLESLMNKQVTTTALLAIGFFVAHTIGLGGSMVEVLHAAQAKKTTKPSAAQSPPPVIMADFQVSQLEDGTYLLRIQSSGPLAFDRLKGKNARQVIVQLYRTRLGVLPSFDPPSFGSMSMTEDSLGNVLLTINLASAKYRATVSQGGNPNIIEIRIRG